KLTTPNAKPADLEDARKAQADALKDLGKAAAYLAAQADLLKEKQPVPEVRARMLYEAAWAYRELAEPEVADARAKIQERLAKTRRAKAVKNNAQQQPAAIIAPLEVALATIKVQPSEAKARAQYEALIEAFPDLPLATEARLELAELLSQRE